ncbi:MAG: MarR family transcriptional regulator [Gemmatimonadaceae bacterium]|nr:MarR family transcriptional regulator [Gemmatimonadaceae bacterium]
MSGKGDKKRRRALDAYGRLQRAAGLAATRVEAAVHPFGLSASQFGVLDTIAARGAVHQQELAEALGRSKAQMTAIIDALESRGLVRRERHATDRRFITVHLTDAGTAVLEQATPARTAAIVDLMSELTGEQRARLARLCRRLLRTLDPDEAERETESGEAESGEAESEADADSDEVEVTDSVDVEDAIPEHHPLPS